MYTHDITRALSPAAGNNGVSEPVYKRALLKTQEAVISLQNNPLPLIAHSLSDEDLPAIEAMAASIRSRFSTVVVCGMGGSSLSGKMLTALAYNAVTHLSGKIRLLFVDNIDPTSIDTLVTSLDFASTMFLMISKSGGTAETLSHIGIFWAQAEKTLSPTSIADHFLVITEPTDNSLARFAKKHGIGQMNHPIDIGGRYAALTLVGLLPAAIAGLNIRSIRKGAASVVDECFNRPETAAPVQGAALSFVMAEQGKNISVMLPYCDRLWNFALWHRQIWAESLGKKGKGITPAPALGSVDQHSQLQLYLDGPRDKFFTMLLLKQRDKGAVITLSDEPTLSHLHQRTIGDLIDAQQYATLETFMLKQCPVRALSLTTLDETALGELTMHFMLETILTGYLMQIDPFDQPVVEDGKKLAIQHLSKQS